MSAFKSLIKFDSIVLVSVWFVVYIRCSSSRMDGLIGL